MTLRRLMGLLLMICLLCVGSVACAQSAPATAPHAHSSSLPSATASTQEAATATASAPAISPAAAAILKQLEEAATKFPMLVADMQYHAKLTQLGDVEERAGKVYWQAGGKGEPAKFRIHFDTLKQGDDPKARTVKNVEDFAFDGEWFTIRKEKVKQMTREQVPPEDRQNALQLGKGPFPVPFGQKVEDVVRVFSVSTRPLKEGEPANTEYIKLVTRPGQKVDVVWVELWVDTTTGLPAKIVAQDKSENITTVVFKNIQTPPSLPKDTFNLPAPPKGEGWEFNVNPFSGGK